MSFQAFFLSLFIGLNLQTSHAQTKSIQAAPHSLVAQGFDLCFRDCIETLDNDVIFVGRFDKGRQNVFDSVYTQGGETLPEWIKIHTSLYRDSCPTKILLHKVSSSGEEIWTRLYDFGVSGIKMEIDKSGFIYVLSNSNESRSPVITKLDSDGEIIWSKELISDRNSRGIDIAFAENGQFGVLATTQYFRSDSDPSDTLGYNYAIPNSRFMLLDTSGNILSDKSYVMPDKIRFNYPQQLVCHKNNFYASISLSGHMSTWSQISKVGSDGSIGKFIQTDFVSTGLFSESQLGIDDKGKIYIIGQLSRDNVRHHIHVLNSQLTTTVEKRTKFYGQSSSYTIPVSDGLLVVGYDDYANSVVKYSKNMNEIWSMTYYSSIAKHSIYERNYEQGIVIWGVVPAKNGGCFIMGTIEIDSYENLAVVYALDKNGKLLW
jgi:hypothetical protein